MRIFARLIPLIAALLIAGCAQNMAHGAAPFAPSGGGYTVNMPGEPKESTDEGAHMATSSADDNFYMVRYKELSDPVNESSPHAQHMLDRAAATWAEGDGHRLVWKKAAKVDGHPARDLLVQTKDGTYMRVRIAVTHTRIYQVVAAADADDKKAAAFVESFHFTGK